jgi:hypothetical protein
MKNDAYQRTWLEQSYIDGFYPDEPEEKLIVNIPAKSRTPMKKADRKAALKTWRENR